MGLWGNPPIFVYLLRPSSGWFNYLSRLECLKREILLLNLAINSGTPLDLPTHLIKVNDAKQELKRSELGEFVSNSKYDWMDHLFIKYRKIKSEYKFQKFSVLPLIDPNLLPNGVVMMGYEGRNLPDYYVVSQNRRVMGNPPI